MFKKKKKREKAFKAQVVWKCVTPFSGCSTPTCHSRRLCSGSWQQIMKRTPWAIWVAWPLPLAADCLAKCHICKRPDKERHSDGHSLETDAPLRRRAPSPHLFFIFVTRPVDASRLASGVCAGGAWANVKWTIKKRSERVIFLRWVLFSQNVNLVHPLHTSSDLSCVNVCRRTFF